jgi:hypothetical protein
MLILTTPREIDNKMMKKRWIVGPIFIIVKIEEISTNMPPMIAVFLNHSLLIIQTKKAEEIKFKECNITLEFTPISLSVFGEEAHQVVNTITQA